MRSSPVYNGDAVMSSTESMSCSRLLSSTQRLIHAPDTFPQTLSLFLDGPSRCEVFYTLSTTLIHRHQDHDGACDNAHHASRDPGQVLVVAMLFPL